MTEPARTGDPRPVDKALAPCPHCGAPWHRTEMTGEARHGGGYRLLCHECGHKWDDVHASHHVREDEHRRIVKAMLARQDEAYGPPRGSWLQRWVPGFCRHERVRCTHGDEIIGRRYRRRVCLDCGRSLRGPLPVDCFFTGEPHSLSNASTMRGDDGG